MYITMSLLHTVRLHAPIRCTSLCHCFTLSGSANMSARVSSTRYAPADDKSKEVSAANNAIFRKLMYACTCTIEAYTSNEAFKHLVSVASSKQSLQSPCLANIFTMQRTQSLQGLKAPRQAACANHLRFLTLSATELSELISRV